MFKLLLPNGKYWKGGITLSKSSKVGKTWSSKQAFTLAILQIMEDFNPIVSNDKSKFKEFIFLSGSIYEKYYPMLRNLKFIKQTGFVVEEFPTYNKKYDLVFYILDYLNAKNNKFRKGKEQYPITGLYLCEKCGMITDDPSLFKNKVVCKKCKEELENDSAG